MGLVLTKRMAYEVIHHNNLISALKRLNRKGERTIYSLEEIVYSTFGDWFANWYHVYDDKVSEKYWFNKGFLFGEFFKDKCPEDFNTILGHTKHLIISHLPYIKEGMREHCRVKVDGDYVILHDHDCESEICQCCNKVKAS
ncbi:hypothetical protein CKF54_00330 [Psittacicella hinzii]|uniref:Uncharacterized protein n=1 Tax=Psittacicella hinzii TaxID=2028575 RepID=A0A3A1YAV4_9GAMM|nr:hypothetical protein [Psittacicella hinzii]RIY34476.1 hypothetical protein CKF54_00330 [Psittacicella hinzii]